MTGIQAVLLPVGTDIYAVPMDWVKEVVAAPPPTRLVTAPLLVLGLFNLRGQIVPLLDTAMLLGLTYHEPATFALVLQSRDGPVGLVATPFLTAAFWAHPSAPRSYQAPRGPTCGRAR